MASKSAQQEVEKAEVIEELLEIVDKALDRVKVLYEQFFLGIQKQPPTHIHTDVERKLRDLQQMQIRNTALRYRFATLQQKFGSYNNYWRRTLRQIENGTYYRNLAKLGRQAASTGEEIPEEILAAMPKRMREQVKRDREAALALKRRREGTIDDGSLQDGEQEVDMNDLLEEIDTSTNPALPKVTRGGAHVLDSSDGDFDVDAFFKSVINEEQTSPDARAFVSETPTPVPRAPATGASGAMRAAASGAMPASSSGSMPASSSGSMTASSSSSMPAVGRAPTFDGEMPTESDLEPPRPAPATRPSGAHPPANAPAASAAVRAAIGLRTPPAGVPRVTPSSTPAVGGAAPPAVGVAPPAVGVAPPAVGGVVPPNRQSQPLPAVGAPNRQSQPLPAVGAPNRQSQPLPTIPQPASMPSQPVATQPLPVIPKAPSQGVRPLPVMPGASRERVPVPVETLSGPFPREQRNPSGPQPAVPHAPSSQSPSQPQSQPQSRQPSQPQSQPQQSQPHPRQPSQPQSQPRPAQSPSRTQPVKPVRATTEPGITPPQRMGPPPGMTDADVNALYAKYVKAKEAVGEKAGPGSYGKLLQTINAQAPKIMEQYKAKGVDFQVVVKDNQVVIRAKPKP